MTAKFPKNFFWGSATSAHQIEGGNHNDWSEWEKKTASSKWRMAGSKNIPEHLLNIYPSPFQKDNYISGIATDHYNRFRSDFSIAKRLGHNAHRLSIEWSRIEPKEGEFNDIAIAHYRKVIGTLFEMGLEPFVTLYHWTLPVWFRDKGGWLHRDACGHFIRFVEKVVWSYPKVRYWATINEPAVYAMNGYYRGLWPPQEQNIWRAIRVFYKLADAHCAVFQAIKAIRPRARVGFAKNNNFFESSGGVANNTLAALADWGWNHVWFQLTRDNFDFVGLNYYFHSRVNWGFNKNANEKVSDMGWELYPEGLYHILVDLARYKKPIYILENGIADSRDKYRAGFIRAHIDAMQKAMAEGADVRGYFYWSLLDNFEWDKGFWPRFGLVAVDYKTLKRHTRASARVFRDIIHRSIA